MSSPTVIPCPNCRTYIDADSRFCKHCAFNLATNNPALKSRPESRKSFGGGEYLPRLLLVAIIGLLLAGVLYVVGKRRPSSSSEVYVTTGSSNSRSAASTNNSRSSAVSNSGSSLSRGRVEDAVKRMLSNLKQGGDVSVDGIQELPQQNSAVADLSFNAFEYAADDYGRPVASNKYNPKPLPTDRLPTPGEMFQPRIKLFTGRGNAMLTRYNDGEWVLKEVRWAGVGWQGAVKVN